ncbi:MAG: hypothetical protein AAGD38_09750 [Acidobacteriota bacterium]
MTCIVGVIDGASVVLGADSAGTMGHRLQIRTDKKVFRQGPYQVGFTTSFRMGQILRYHTELPHPPENEAELEPFMVKEVVTAVRHTFAEQGFAKIGRFTDQNVTEEGQELGGAFLVGVSGQLFEIQSDFQVARLETPYAAIGHGAPIALGALHALTSSAHLTPHERARRALEAAETYSSSVRRPFHLVE